ncbi:MAG: hypothetical protein PHU46_06550 [Rhodocyclaceae bacterium]|nr:hypothetical protein [Rhodocyclaceae bacterium]
MEQEQQKAEPLTPGEIAQEIVRDCGLAGDLALSVCLCCGNRVLAQDARKNATLYCKALFRDLEICITRCTAFTPE